MKINVMIDGKMTEVNLTDAEVANIIKQNAPPAQPTDKIPANFKPADNAPNPKPQTPDAAPGAEYEKRFATLESAVIAFITEQSERQKKADDAAAATQSEAAKNSFVEIMDGAVTSGKLTKEKAEELKKEDSAHFKLYSNNPESLKSMLELIPGKKTQADPAAPKNGVGKASGEPSGAVAFKTSEIGKMTPEEYAKNRENVLRALSADTVTD